MRTSQTRWISCLVLALLVGAGLAPNAGATSYSWDGLPGTAGDQAYYGGDWSTVSNNWWTGSANITWPNNTSPYDDAVFGTGARAYGANTINVASGIKVGNITFWHTANGAEGYILSGGDITLPSGATIKMNGNVATGQMISHALNGQINSVLHGGAINIGDGTAVGKVNLGGANDYTGVTTIYSNAVLKIASANALGTIAGGTVVNAGGTLFPEYSGTLDTYDAITINGFGVDGNGAIQIKNCNMYFRGPATVVNTASRVNNAYGNVVLYFMNGFTATGSGQNLTFGGTGLISCDGSIATGNGSVTYDGTYTLWLYSSANSFTGGLFFNSSGTLRAMAEGTLGPSDSATVTFGPGATGRLRLEAATQTQTIVGLNSNAGNPGTPVISPGNAWPWRLAQTLVVNNATANTYAGTLADGETGYKLSLTKGAAGTLTLSNNTYTGTTTINGGMLLAAHSNALGTAGTITVNTNGTLGVASGVTFSRAVTFNAGSGLAGSGTFVTNAALRLPAVFRLTPGLSTNTPATLTVNTANNALIATNSTRLEIDFKADGTADKLVVAGSGTLNLGTTTTNGTLVLRGTIKTGSYVVASAPGGVTGQFKTVDKTGLDTTAVSVSYPGDGTVVVTKGAAGTTVMVR